MSMADDYVKQNRGYTADNSQAKADASAINQLLGRGVSKADQQRYNDADRLTTYVSHPDAVKKYGAEYYQDGIPRAWVPDGKRYVAPEGKSGTLGGIIPDSEVYEYYPELRDVKVSYAKNGGGSYSPSSNAIEIDDSYSHDSFATQSGTVHEMQHAAQNIEKDMYGVATGSSPYLEEHKLFSEDYGRALTIPSTHVGGYSLEDPALYDKMYMANPGEREAYASGSDFFGSNIKMPKKEARAINVVGRDYKHALDNDFYGRINIDPVNKSDQTRRNKIYRTDFPGYNKRPSTLEKLFNRLKQ